MTAFSDDNPWQSASAEWYRDTAAVQAQLRRDGYLTVGTAPHRELPFHELVAALEARSAEARRRRGR